MDLGLPVVAGTLSTAIFAGSMLPMLVKAARTRDLGSYSLGNIILTNVGNIIHSAYIFHLPAGPVWALHTFYLVTMALMLVWYLRYERHAKSGRTSRPTPTEHEEESAGSPDSPGPAAPWRRRPASE